MIVNAKKSSDYQAPSVEKYVEPRSLELILSIPQSQLLRCGDQLQR
jgi:hypothetical protein